MFATETVPDRRQTLARRIDAHVRPQSRDRAVEQEQPGLRPREWRGSKSCGCEQVGIAGESPSRMPEGRGQHADDLENVAVEPNPAPDRVVLPAEPARPQAMTDDCDAGDAGMCVTFIEQPSAGCRHAKHAEVLGAGEDAFDALGLDGLAGKVGVDAVDAEDAVEEVRLASISLEFRHADPDVPQT
jgi:hypothetical protein